MKLINGFDTSILLALICLGQDPVDPARPPGYSITLSVSPGPLTVRSPLKVQVTETNRGDKDVWREVERIPEPVYGSFRIRLTRDGREVETTWFDRWITGRNRPGDPDQVFGGSSILLPLHPGESMTASVDIRWLYEVTEPGGLHAGREPV